jgi:mitogen-activated protein kinase kinase
MLLNHGWLAPLSKPATISEEDEALDEDLSALDLDGNSLAGNGSSENMFDKEVSDWVLAAIEKKRNGKMGFAAKPALHAAPLDSMSPTASPAAI